MYGDLCIVTVWILGIIFILAVQYWCMILNCLYQNGLDSLHLMKMKKCFHSSSIYRIKLCHQLKLISGRPARFLWNFDWLFHGAWQQRDKLMGTRSTDLSPTSCHSSQKLIEYILFNHMWWSYGLPVHSTSILAHIASSERIIEYKITLEGILEVF